ncbi:hypothetical protein TVAG_232790 [Trichomonas vaginalis G3]|uniref:Uncharacterized protein n=1 Tax=Trichomonas vaginalis (strain ATCC PRA-98 / G3) TaxID=412133 RepID=A2FVZ3_TRIV3|nr:GAF domain-like family [Trichomonas vaginalis G3]EAX90922.1 hypothetical protein TVAG_232790 [Trichomonas vaginalis G3]KAI5516452.1 GAF domain-like family [Trichomonas vaginalis G3]|eukprot:XP_001303852.1 hypothetical protein [Trichomonas vaginalis G3]
MTEDEISTLNIDKTQEIEVYIEKKSQLQQTYKKLRLKLLELRKSQNQYLQYFTKIVNDCYGEKVDVPKDEPIIPPSPSVKMPMMQEDFFRILRIAGVTDLDLYLNESSVVESQIFCKNTIFDDATEKAISLTQPALRITLLDDIMNHIAGCKSYLDKLVPLFHSITTNPLLEDNLIKSGSRKSKLYEYYFNTLEEFAKLLEVDECKIVFKVPNTDELIYPTEEFMHVLPLSKTLSGYLYSQVQLTQINNPLDDINYDTSRENCIFTSNKSVLCAAFSITLGGIGGLILLFNKSFTPLDKSRLSLLSSYVAPLLFVLRSVFIQVAPRHFRMIGNVISKFRTEKNALESFQQQFCFIASAERCRVLLAKSDPNEPEIPVLQEGPSLIRKSIGFQSVSTYTSPRSHKDFNMAIDNDQTLSRITSMMVLKVENTNFVIVLYNSLVSTNFSQVQSTLATLFSMSLPPILHQIKLIKEIEKFNNQNKIKQEKTDNIISVFGKLVKIVKEGGDISDVLPENTNLKVGRFNEYKELYDVFDGEKIEIEFGQEKSFIDKNGKFVVTDNNFVCVYENFKNDEDSKALLVHLSHMIFIVIPTVLIKNVLAQISEANKDLCELICGNFRTLSNIIGCDVQFVTYEYPPASAPEGRKYQKLITSSRGIEAEIYSEEELDDEQKGLLDIFADWIQETIVISKKPNTTKIIEFLVDSGFTHTFDCSFEDVNRWVNTISSFFLAYDINFESRIEALDVAHELLTNQAWQAWFSSENRLIIYILILLSDLETVFRFVSDEETNKLFEGNKKCSHPIIAAVFGTNFGVGANMDYEKKKSICKKFSDYTLMQTVTEQSAIYGHLRGFSGGAFKNPQEGDLWLAKGVQMVIKLYPLKCPPNEALQKAKDALGEEKVKQLIYLADRLYIPILTMMCQKNEVAAEFLNAARTSLREIKNAK